MARLRDCLPRLMVTIRSLLFWSLIYCYCGLCASIYLLKLLWSIGKGPAQTFRRVAREHPPPCLNDPSLGTHCYVRIKDSGLRFHYVAAGERGKPLMLLLHGFPEFWYSWRHQLREFKSEYRVVALDLRGYGETDAPIHRENYKLDCLITDIRDILDSLGYSKCVLIGHDWGGMIAWLIAICYPEMVMKLIVINFPHPNVFTEYILRHPAQLFKSSYYYFFQIPWFPEFMFSINDFKALKHLFTSHSTGIGRKGFRLTTEDLEAHIYVFSQPGALSGPINHYRNIFRKWHKLEIAHITSDKTTYPHFAARSLGDIVSLYSGWPFVQLQIGFSITVVKGKKFGGAVSTTSGKRRVFHTHLIGKKIKLSRTSVGNDVEQSELLYAACGAYNQFGKQLDNTSCLPLKHHMVTTPTLLLWGEKDAFMEVEMAEVTKTYVKNYFRLTILSEASHWLQQEQPDIVNKLIWTFLKEETRKKD